MSFSTTVDFTASDGELVVGGRHYGPPAELTNPDFKTRDAAAYAAAKEYVAPLH